MNEIIQIRRIDGNSAISARELYDFLEPTERFAQWFSRQCQYGFTKDTDYVGCEEFNTLANQLLIDYALTLDCAKEISMIQRSEKGKIARQYFIECEKKLKNQFAIPQTYSEALMLASKQAEVIELQKVQLEIAAPKVEFFDAVTGSSDAIDIGSASKVLNMNIGRNKLFGFLRDKKVLMSNNQPYQSHIDSGYFRTIEQKYVKLDGSTCINIKTVVYQRGLDYIRKLYLKRA